MKDFKNRMMNVPQVSDDSIKVFSYKGAAIICVTCIMATAVVPWLFSLAGIHSKMVTVLSTSLLGSLGISYVRNFIDSKKGMSKGFLLQFILFFAAFFVISYYWIFYQYYI